MPISSQAAGKAFDLADFFAHMNDSGTIPFALIETELVAAPAERGTPLTDSLYEPRAAH